MPNSVSHPDEVIVLKRRFGQGAANIDKYLELIKKDISEIRNELREEAQRKVKTRMILLRIAEQESFEVTEEDIEKEMGNIAELYKMEKEKVKEMMSGRLEFIEKEIRFNRAVEYIFSNAKVKGAKK